MDADGLRRASAGHDAIIHLAAVPGPGRASAADLLTLNVIGTVNVLEAAVARGVERVVLASSAAATGFSFQTHDIVPRYLPIDEAHPDAPQDEYGLSKLLAEAALQALHRPPRPADDLPADQSQLVRRPRGRRGGGALRLGPAAPT